MDCTDQKDKARIPQSPDLTFKVKFVDKEPPHCWARDDGSCRGFTRHDGPYAFAHVYKASCLLKSSRVSASFPLPLWTNAIWIHGSPEPQWDGPSCIWIIISHALSPTQVSPENLSPQTARCGSPTAWWGRVATEVVANASLFSLAAIGLGARQADLNAYWQS